MNKTPENFLQSTKEIIKDGVILNSNSSFCQVKNAERVATVLGEIEFFNLDDRI